MFRKIACLSNALYFGCALGGRYDSLERDTIAVWGISGLLCLGLSGVLAVMEEADSILLIGGIVLFQEVPVSEK